MVLPLQLHLLVKVPEYTSSKEDFNSPVNDARNLFPGPRASSAMENRGVGEQIYRLASGNVIDCTDAKPFTVDESREYLKDLPGWVLLSNSIQKEFRFKSYLRGLDFAYSLGKIAEQENHHPDLVIGWRRVKVVFSTHAIKGLSQNDFVMAAKSELEYTKYRNS